MPQTHLVVVDDDPDLCELIEDALSDEYSIHTCNDVTQAELLIKEIDPSIVLLDINLPGGNGLKFCEALGNIAASPFVLLISGDNSLDLRLEAYAHGGADFLAKPFRIQELKAKVQALNQFQLRHSELQQSSEFAAKTAMNAMAEASQYGEVLRFYNAMYKADTLEDIKKSFFGLMTTFGLQSSIQFRLDQTYTFDFLSDECSPIELQIYENLSQSERLLPFSKRLMINGTYVSIIVKNMPTEDEVSNGRLRDILATLTEGLDAKLVDLQRLGLLKQTSNELASSSQRLANVVKDHETNITSAMNHVVTEINSSFHILELTEKQEEFFTHLTEAALQSMEESFVQIGNETDILDCIRLSLSVFLNTRSPD